MIRQWNGMALTERTRPLDWRTLAYDFAHFEVTDAAGEWTLACTTSETASARLSDMPPGSAKWGVTATGERVKLKYNVVLRLPDPSADALALCEEAANVVKMWAELGMAMPPKLAYAVKQWTESK